MEKPIDKNAVAKETGAPVQPTPVRERKKRTPVGGARDVLTLTGKDPNYEYRFIVDAPGRVQRFIDGGWEVVTDPHDIGQVTVDRGSKVGSAVTKASGDGRTLVAMRIPKEWYDEDQKAKQDRLDALDQAMKAENVSNFRGFLEIQRNK